MQPLQELLHRIMWDPVFGEGEFALGYEDRVARRRPSRAAAPRNEVRPKSSAGGSRPELYRVFIAISIPEPAKDAIAQAQEHLRGALPGTCVRWARREQLHLALKFLGNVAVPRLDAMTATRGGLVARKLELGCHRRRVPGRLGGGHDDRDHDGGARAGVALGRAGSGADEAADAARDVHRHRARRRDESVGDPSGVRASLRSAPGPAG